MAVMSAVSPVLSSFILLADRGLGVPGEAGSGNGTVRSWPGAGLWCRARNDPPFHANQLLTWKNHARATRIGYPLWAHRRPLAGPADICRRRGHTWNAGYPSR